MVRKQNELIKIRRHTLITTLICEYLQLSVFIVFCVSTFLCFLLSSVIEALNVALGLINHKLINE